MAALIDYNLFNEAQHFLNPYCIKAAKAASQIHRGKVAEMW